MAEQSGIARAAVDFGLAYVISYCAGMLCVLGALFVFMPFWLPVFFVVVLFKGFAKSNLW